MYDKLKEDEVIIYLARRVEPANPRKLLDVLYLAEKLHLSRYGRTITGCQWWAGHDGVRPLRWRSDDMLPSEGKWSLELSKMQAVKGNPYWTDVCIRPLREPNRREFSETDEECLDEIVRHSQEQGDRKTYDEARDWAWAQAVDGLARRHFALMPLLSIALTLPNALAVIKLLYQEGQLPQIV